MSSIVARISAWLLALWILSSILFCEATVHVPRAVHAAAVPQIPFAARVTVESVRASDGTRLEAWLAAPTMPGSSCVLILHGIGDTRAGATGFAPMFLQQGYMVLTPDSRAHGNSGGSLITFGALEQYDVLAWTRLLRSKGCQKLYGLGESLGASILIQASALEPAFRAIVAECPYADLREMGEYRLHQFPGLPRAIARPIIEGGFLYARIRYGVDIGRVSPLSAMAATRTPVLLIHGTADTRTPDSHSRRLAQANPRSSLWLVAGADHVSASTTDPEGFRTRVLNWFSR